MGVWPWLKANFFPLHLVFGYVFVTSGLVVSFLMLLSWIFIWPWNKSLYRKMVMNLAYSHWCQLTFLCQWWSGTDCTVHMDDIDTLKYLGTEHTVALLNHKYDIDWLVAWMLCERKEMLGGTKIYGKWALKMVPILGWAWTFTDSIFLKRDWEKDKKIISDNLDLIREYPDGYNITLVLCCEGTRFTPEKHKLSMEVARQKGLPELKHHLLPRTRGAVHIMQGVKGKVPGILDLTLAFRKDAAEPTLMSILQGKACKAEMFMRRIDINDVPTEEAECTEWIQEVFQEKDRVFEDFHRNGHFTRGVTVEIPRRLQDLLICLMWFILLFVPFFFYISNILLTGSWTLILTVTAVTAVVAVMVRGMIAQTEIKTTSSHYGVKDNGLSQENNNPPKESNSHKKMH